MNTRYRLVLVTLAVVVCTSFHCMDKNTANGTGLALPDRMELYSGNLQSGVCGMPSSSPLAVRVFTSDNRPALGVYIEFVAIGGNAKFVQSIVPTGNDGIAKAYYSYGMKADSFVVQAVYQGIKGSPIDFRLKALAASGASFNVGKIDKDLTAGERYPIKVLVRDQFLNPSPQATVNFTVIAGRSFCDKPSVLTDTSGVAINYWTMDTIAGTYTQIRITLADTTPVPNIITASVVPASPAIMLIYSGNNQVGFVETPAVDALVVYSKDKYGNYQRGLAQVYFTPLDGGTITGGWLDTLNVPAIKANSYTYGKKPGMYRVRSSFKSAVPVDFILNAYQLIKLDPIAMASNAAVLQWTKNSSAGFQSYKVLRDTIPKLTKQSPVIATITDQSITTYVDATVSHPHYYYYRILISFTNGDKLLTNEEYIVP